MEVVFLALGIVLGVLLKTLVSFWIVLDPGRFQEPSGSMIAISFSRFWIDFEATFDTCCISKSRKRRAKSISQTNQVFDIYFYEFWLILFGFVNHQKPLVLKGFLQVRVFGISWFSESQQYGFGIQK